MSVAVGIDLVAIEDVEASVERHADRYLTRVYTAQELADCRRAAGAPAAERLAARFAAKEAALKVLRSADEAIPWRDIGVRRGSDGSPSLELSGAARAAAQRRGVRSLEVSLTHEGPFAAAVVVAELGSRR